MDDTFHTLVHLSPNQLKFVPANKHLNNNLNIPLLRTSDCPIDVVNAANEE
jgi:hypothetical protein